MLPCSLAYIFICIELIIMFDMNNDKSKNDNEGIRKEYETFHALKNIFPVFFNGIDEPSYFKNVKNKNKEEIKSNYSASIIYLH